MTVHRPTGTREPGGEVVTPGLVEAVAVAPDGDGWVVLLSNAAVVDDREDDYRLRAVVVRADRRVGPLLALEGSDDESISSMAVSLRHERVFVRVTEAEGAASLRCLRLEAEDGLQEVWRAAAPWETSLVRDPAGVDVVALIPGPDGTGVRPLALGLRPPELPARKRRPLFPIPYESTFCHPPRPTSPAEALERERLEGLSTLEDRGSWATGRVMEGGMEVRGAACLVQALSRRGYGELADDVLALARERFGDDVHLLEVELDRAVARGRWAAVAEACGRIEGVVGEDGMGPHMHHLVGICRLEAGDPVGAIEAWRAAGEGGGVCGLTGAIEAAQAAFLDGDADHPLAVLMRGIEAADVALERGDPECAVGALEGTLVWAWTELQGLARLCRAWLDLTPAAWDGDGPQPDSAQRLRARVAAAAFTAALRSSDHRSSWARPPNLPVPHGRRWDRDRLAALAAEATAWLDAV